LKTYLLDVQVEIKIYAKLADVLLGWVHPNESSELNLTQ